jgi:acetylornithine deacetylase/succinyl-diaminopimelate desuccinylase-like protein
VDARRDQTARFLAAIGGIVSPSGREGERAQAVAAEMRRIGLADVTLDATPNVVGRIRGRSGKALIFVSTLDDLATVAALQTSTHATLRIDGDRVVGPGANTSTTTAALIAAADALMRSGLRPEHDLVFAAVAQEETDSRGCRRSTRSGGSRVAFCRHPRRRHSIAYGAITDSLVESGRQRHAGTLVERRRPNVNQGIGRAVDRILQLPQPERYAAIGARHQRGDAPNGAVYNATNRTPRFRSTCGRSTARVEEVEAEVRKILAGVTAETTIAFTMEPTQMTPGGQIPGLRDSALVTTAAAISAHLGYAAQLGDAGSSNMNVALGQGTAAIGIGGNRGGQRGFADEWANIPQMMRTAKYLVLLAATIGM